MEQSEVRQIDLKPISLSLFSKEVVVILKPKTEISTKHGSVISGRLIGRIWGERLLTENEATETVVAITVATNDKEVTLNYHDIFELKEI